MGKMKLWMLAAILSISGTVFTSCSSNDDNTIVDNDLAGKIVGKWIHADITFGQWRDIGG